MFIRHKKAFTLVELLVVISIIALLLAIMMPALSKAREQAKRVVCATNLRSIGLTYMVYAAENEGKYPRGKTWSSAATCMGYFYVIYQGDFRILVKDYMESPDIFYCPSGGAWDWEWIRSPDHPKGWNGIDASGASIGMFSYCIWPSDGFWGDPVAAGDPSFDAIEFERPDGFVVKESDVKHASSQIMAQDFARTEEANDMSTPRPTFLNHPGARSPFTHTGEISRYGFNNLYYDGHTNWRSSSNAEVMGTTRHSREVVWFR